MAKIDVIRSHVELLMQRFLGVDELVVESSGAIMVQHRSAMYCVRVLPREDPHVNIFSTAVVEIDADPGLFEALNDYNATMSHARAFWSGQRVIVDAELLGESLDLNQLVCVIYEVANWSHQEGPKLVATFGGEVAFPEEIDHEEEESQ